MLIVLAIHLFTAIGLMPMGLMVLRLLGARLQAPVHVVFAGYAVAACYAMLWSFFAPVDLWASGVFIVLALVALWWHREAWSRLWSQGKQAVRSAPWWVIGAWSVVVLVALLKAAAPSEMYDEGGYYMPYMKWIERFPLMPGLANVEDRMGFNSAHHIVSALFSFDAVGTGGYYDLNAFLMIVAAAWFVGGLKGLVHGKDFRAFDVGRVCCLFLLMRNMLTSATSDLPTMLLGQVVLLSFIQRWEAGEMERKDGDGLLSLMLAAVAITVKFSALPLVLPGLWILWRQGRSRRGRSMVRALAIAAFVFGPWLVRSYFLSGYLVYPLHQFSFFDPDWRVPLHIAETQYHYVSEFARSNARPEESIKLAGHRGIREWLPLWYARETLLCRLFFWALLAGTCWTLVRGGITLVRRKAHSDVVFLMAALLIGLGLWFYRNPSFRFGWAWVLVFLAVVLFDVARRTRTVHVVRWGLVIALGATLPLNLVSAAREHKGRLSARLVHPAPPIDPGSKEDHRWVYPVRLVPGNQCWAVAPPCFTVTDFHQVEPRGPRPEDGFRWKDPGEGEKE